MTRERKHTNARMSQIVIHGDTVYLAGQVAVDAAGELAGAQMKNILDRIDGLLGEAGSDKSKILSATIWLVDMRDFAAINEVWDAWFGLGCGRLLGLEVWGSRGTPPRILRPCCGEASSEHAEQSGIRVGGGEVDSDAGGLFDDAGADLEQPQPEGAELSLGERTGGRDGVAKAQHQPVGSGMEPDRATQLINPGPS